jgi:hypothetical protein
MCGGVVVQSFTFELIFLSSQYSKNATKFDPGQENKYVAVELLEVNTSILLPSFDDIVAQSRNSKRRKEKLKLTNWILQELNMPLPTRQRSSLRQTRCSEVARYFRASGCATH